MWRWQGVVAVILALGITGTLLTVTISGAINPARMSPLTQEEASALTTVLGAVIGALAVFLGVRNGHRPDPQPRLPPAEPELVEVPLLRDDPAEASLDAAAAEQSERMVTEQDENPAGFPA